MDSRTTLNVTLDTAVYDLPKKMTAEWIFSHLIFSFYCVSFQLHPIESPDFGQLTRVQGLATPSQLAVS